MLLWNDRRRILLSLLAKSCLILAAFNIASSALAGPRTFYMALWNSQDASNVDFRWFWLDDVQPSGYSILQIRTLDVLAQSDSRQPGDVLARLSAEPYDWSRIVAVVIDEPYWTAVSQLRGSLDFSRPCTTRPDQTESQIRKMAAGLAQTVSWVNNRSRPTRFWINFSKAEIQWMQQGGACDFPLLESYIDVVSLDEYELHLSEGPGNDYDWILGNLSGTQQLGLVPGVFVNTPAGNPTPDFQSTVLQEFYDYAVLRNPQCQLDPRNLAAHTPQDGCKVWIIAGWYGQGSPVDVTGQDSAPRFWSNMFEDSTGEIPQRWKSLFGPAIRGCCRRDQATAVLQILNLLEQ